MASRDRTPDSDSQDRDGWFDEPAVTDIVSATTVPDRSSGRKLTVLTERHPDADPDDDWFDHDGPDVDALDETDTPEAGPRVSAPLDEVDGYRSFDARTSVLRTRGSAAPAARTASWWRRHRGAVAVTSAIAVLGGSVVGAGLLFTGFGGDTPPPGPMALDEVVATTVPASTLPAAAGAAAADVTWCAGQADGKPVTEDSTDPGAAAIWAFEKAFYFDRDSAAARAAGAPDAVMASAQRLQQGLDQLEPDIEFCVLAEPVDAGVYDVTVVERGPGIDGRMSRQRITTAAQQDGQTLITAIVPR